MELVEKKSWGTGKSSFTGSISLNAQMEKRLRNRDRWRQLKKGMREVTDRRKDFVL